MNKFTNFSMKKDDLPKKDLASDRILFFSDAVFAIAITLLALEIRLPDNVDLTSDSSVWHAISSLTPHYIAFFVSFLIIGRLWASHVRKYSGGILNDRTFITLNLFMLMIVAFMPFPTNLFSISTTRAATIFYSFTMVLVGFFSALTWWYAAIKNKYVHPARSEKEVRTELFSSLSICFIFGLSILVAFVNPNIARWTWLLFIPALRWVR